METLAVINQKGGVGKTTTAGAIGAGLILKGYRVLFVDLDAQGNLSYTMKAKTRGAVTIEELLQQAVNNSPVKYKPEDAIQHTEQGDIIASSPNIVGIDAIFADVIGKEYKLREILDPLQSSYDYCIIDTPPTLGTFTINALTASTGVIAPAQAEIFSLTALSQLNSTIETVKKYCNPTLSFKGIVLTRYNSRAILSREAAEQIERLAVEMGTKLYSARIRECMAIKEAQITQQTIYSYSPKSNAVQDYKALINEILGE